MSKLIIPVAHDFNCPWCWIGFSQIQNLKAEFGVEFEYRGYELFPPEMEWPDAAPDRNDNPDKPKTPSRLQLAMAAEGLAELRKDRPKKMRTYFTHRACEYARTLGLYEAAINILYPAHYLDARDINDTDTLIELLGRILPDRDALLRAVEGDEFASKTVLFDDDAYAMGVWNVPTFWIGGERYAEQPYRVLAGAVEAALAPSVV